MNYASSFKKEFPECLYNSSPGKMSTASQEATCNLYPDVTPWENYLIILQRVWMMQFAASEMIF